MPRRTATNGRPRGERDGWNLYVIELRPTVLSNNAFRERNAATYQEGQPCVYVGHTCLTPEERQKQHQRGIHSSKVVRNHGGDLIHDECRRIPPMPRADAEKEEAALAESLRKRGWGTWSN